ncbi:MAG: hypothetical protein IT497_00665 [Ottowia sp.]|nr:hypothetical protein [Ottowia sp.]
MTSALCQLRLRFEKALLSWLRSSVNAPLTGSKHDALQILTTCVQELSISEPHEPYWPHSQFLLSGLLQGQLADQVPCRKVFAQINLLLAQKTQHRHLISAQLWHDTLALQQHTMVTVPPLEDAFLREAEIALQALDEACALWQEQSHAPPLSAVLKATRTMHTLATTVNFELLATLANALERLFIALMAPKATLAGAQEYATLETTKQSMHRLLHQAAAGITPKRDDVFINALLMCEQLTGTHTHPSTP